MLGIMAADVVKRLPVVMNEAAIARPLAAATNGSEGADVDIVMFSGLWREYLQRCIQCIYTMPRNLVVFRGCKHR